MLPMLDCSSSLHLIGKLKVVKYDDLEFVSLLLRKSRSIKCGTFQSLIIISKMKIVITENVPIYQLLDFLIELKMLYLNHVTHEVVSKR